MLQSWRREDRWLVFMLKAAMIIGLVILEAIVLLTIGRLLL